MPKLWNETIEAHRRGVRDAVLDTTAWLVAEQGLLSVTMSQIAERSGIGRATLYKYFPDVEAILIAWHERQVRDHLDFLAEVRDQAGGASERLEAVLEAYAMTQWKRVQHHYLEHHDDEFATGEAVQRRHFSHQERHGSRAHHSHLGDTELAILLHRDEHAARAQQEVSDMIRDVVSEAAEAGHVRDDIAASELASYCLHALGAAGNLPSQAAVQRLVAVTLAGLQRRA